MDLEALFQIANATALAGWLVLLASPFVPRIADAVSGLAIPTVFAIVYSGLMLAFWSRVEGGFDTLAGVMQLFDAREIVLAGWIHYLAFDLFIGAWQVRTARAEAIPFWLILPCLALTFLFGPAGLLAFLALRAARGGLRPA